MAESITLPKGYRWKVVDGMWGVQQFLVLQKRSTRCGIPCWKEITYEYIDPRYGDTSRKSLDHAADLICLRYFDWFTDEDMIQNVKRRAYGE